MGKIKIISTTVEGFGSIIDPIEYKWNGVQLKVISGDNGAGKSTIANALSWCLYSQLLKKGSSIEPWEWIRNESYKGTKVSTLLKVHNGHTWDRIEVIRCKNYTGKVHGQKGADKVFISINGELDTTRNTPERNKLIAKLLGYSFDLFKHAVLIGQKSKKFVEEDGPNKKKVLEEAFDLLFITKAKDDVEQRASKRLGEINQLELKIAPIKAQYKSTKEHLVNLQKYKDEWIIKRQQEVDKIKAEIKAAKKEAEDIVIGENPQGRIDKYQSKLKLLSDKYELENLRNLEFKTNLEHNSAQFSFEVAKKSLELLKGRIHEKKSTTCPTCGKPMDNTQQQGLKKKLLAEIEEQKNVVQEAEKVLIKSQKAYQKSKDALEIAENKLKKVRDKYNGLIENERKELVTYLSMINKKREVEKKIARLTQDLREVENKTNSIDDDLEKYRQKKKSLRKSYKQLDEQLEILKTEAEVDVWLIKDPLSNSGLKAFIFDSMLRLLNQQLAAYQRIVGFRVEVIVDLESSNKNIEFVIHRNKNTVLYNDLSGGQQQLVNIVIILALNDTIVKTKPINILILDEVFESLSRKNTELVTELIREKSFSRDIHLITHNLEFIPTNSLKTHLTLLPTGRTIIS